MQLFKLKTRLSKFDHFADFAREFKLSEHDLVITNEFLYEPFMKSLNLPCHFIMQEKFGSSNAWITSTRYAVSGMFLGMTIF